MVVVVVVVATVLGLALLAVLHGLVLADFVGDGSSACACGAADERAFTASGEATDNGATSG